MPCAAGGARGLGELYARITLAVHSNSLLAEAFRQELPPGSKYSLQVWWFSAMVGGGDSSWGQWRKLSAVASRYYLLAFRYSQISVWSGIWCRHSPGKFDGGNRPLQASGMVPAFLNLELAWLFWLEVSSGDNGESPFDLQKNPKRQNNEPSTLHKTMTRFHLLHAWWSRSFGYIQSKLGLGIV